MVIIADLVSLRKKKILKFMIHSKFQEPTLNFQRVVLCRVNFNSWFNPNALRTAKILWSFDRSECNKVKIFRKLLDSNLDLKV